MAKKGLSISVNKVQMYGGFGSNSGNQVKQLIEDIMSKG